MFFSVVIPTKDRPDDLFFAVESICNQTIKISQLIIIDQSKMPQNRSKITKLISSVKNIKLQYIHDPKVKGLVEAKSRSLHYVTGDIVCFLEDDIILDNNYFKHIKKGFDDNSKMIGCCGVVTNPPKKNFIYKFFFNTFHQGIFKDPRFVIQNNLENLIKTYYPSNMISGGISAWKKEVFDQIKFDIKNSFHLFEDIDFSTRVASYYKNSLFINTNARLEHNCSPINRDFFKQRQKRKVTESFLYYKKRVSWRFAKSSFIILLFGMLLEATFESISSRSFDSLKGYFNGIKLGYKTRVRS